VAAHKAPAVFVLCLAVLAPLLFGSLEPALASLVPLLVLSPASGNAPTVNGTFGGNGWQCGGGQVPSGAVTVSGPGVSGSGAISSNGTDGVVGGSFQVTGAAGASVTITVRANTPCPTIGPPIYLNAEAVFKFNAPTGTPTPAPGASATPSPAVSPTPGPAPTGTPTAASFPTKTPTPASGPGGPSPTNVPGAQEPPSQEFGPLPLIGSIPLTMTFRGCSPSKDEVQLQFTPLYLLGEEPSDQPSGPPMLVSAKRKAGAANAYVFDSPVAEPGRVFKVEDMTADPDCPPSAAGAQAWTAGKAVEFDLPLPGNTSLEACKLIDKVPCEEVLVKGASAHPGEPVREPPASDSVPEGAWVLDITYYKGDLKTRIQRFRWSIQETGVRDITLQASVLPFPKTAEDDYLDPPGLVASWDVHFDSDCGNCEFTVPLKPLDNSPAKGKSLFTKVVDTVVYPFKVVANGFKSLFGGGKKKGPETVRAAKPVIPKTQPGSYLVGGALNPLLQPTTFYFRVVPRKGGDVAGATSNAVVLQQANKPPPVVINTTPTPVPAIPAYEVHILTYHGIIPPLNPNKDCYVVTQEAWPAGPFGLTYTTDPSKRISDSSVKPGHLICKPEPDEPNIFEVILSWAEDAIDWASGAWKDLKSFAVQVALKYTPLGQECSLVENAGAIPAGSCQEAMSFALDAALASLGIPPDIPNFDQLMDEGVNYLAAQAAAQIGIPPEVVQKATEQGGPYAGLALDVAEAQLRAELQQELEAQMKDTVKQVQLGYAAQVSFVPDGIPVRPDDYQPPGATIRVVRKQGVPGGDAGCTLLVRDSLKIPADVIANPPPGWESAINGLPTKLSPLINYDFFVNEADIASGQPDGLDKQLFVPPLAPGDYFDIPVTFKPNYYNSGFSPLGSVSTDTYIGAWYIMHEFGNLSLTAGGSCGSDTLKVPAKAQLLGLETGP
jgi:hypothetical protein